MHEYSKSVNNIHRLPARVLQLSPPATRDRRAARVRSYLLLAFSDTLAIVASFILANALVNLTATVRIEHGFVMLGVILPLFAIQASSNGTYGAATLDDPGLGARRAVGALTLAGGVVLLIAYMLKASAGFSRGVFAIGFVASFVLLIIARRLLQPMIQRLLAGSAHTTIVIGDGVPYVRQGDEVVMQAEALGFDPATTDPRAYHHLARTVDHADRLIVVCTPERAAVWAPVLRTLSVDGEILTDIQDSIGAIGMSQLGDRRTLVINAGPMTFSARARKRAFDFVFALAALIVLAPVLLCTALAIRLESRGPIFFRQERIGRGNTIFRIYKFRSMYTHAADANATMLTQVGDPRVTRVGAFIRRTSIDELPQLLNVLLGDMSVVGPRPHALAAKAADVLYWDVDARYRERHVIKPGMTGLAQIRGFRGNTHQLVDLTNRLQADLEYVATWSLRHDLSIILQTLKVMRHDNAY